MTDAVRALQGAMARFQAANCGGKRAVFGFDGYVDSLCGVVERVDAGGQRHPFASSQAFVGFLAGLGGHSAESELLLKDRRAGGNAPLMANPAGRIHFFHVPFFSLHTSCQILFRHVDGCGAVRHRCHHLPQRLGPQVTYGIDTGEIGLCGFS